MSTVDVPAAAAATVMLLRDSAAGIEVLLQRRRAEMDFGGRALVFPGGRLDEADGDAAMLGPLLGQDLGDTAARMRLDTDDVARRRALALHVCALRELFEEAGLLLARPLRPGAAVPTGAELQAIRARVLGGAPLAGELDRLGLCVDIGALTYVARFLTPLGLPRRYDAHFFATRVPTGAVTAFHAGEAIEEAWSTARDVLAAADAGEAVLMPPTRIMLAEMARHQDVESLLTELGGRPVAAILLRLDQVGGPLPDHLPGIEESIALGTELA